MLLILISDIFLMTRWHNLEIQVQNQQLEDIENVFHYIDFMHLTDNLARVFFVMYARRYTYMYINYENYKK